jgi:hypothetical protein
MFLLWVIPERRAERTVWTSEKNSKPKEWCFSARRTT